MSYKEIKQEIADKKRQISKLKQDSVNIDAQIAGSTKELNNLRAKENEEIRIQSEKSLELAKSDGIKGLERTLNEIDADITELQNNYNNNLKRLKLSMFKKKYKKGYKTLDSAETLSNEVSQVVTEMLGDRIKSELFESLAQYDFTMDVADIDTYIRDADKIKRSLKLFKSKRKFNILEAIDNFLARWNPCRDEDNLSDEGVLKANLIYLGVAISASIAVVYFGALPLFILCLLLGGYNIYRALTLRSIIFSEHILSSNVKNMREKLDSLTQSDYDKYLKGMENKFHSYLNNLEDKRAKKEEQLQIRLRQIENDFVFDDSEIKNMYQTHRKVKQKNIDNLNESKMANNKNIQTLEQAISKLQLDLQNELSVIKQQYCTLKGTEYILEPTYALDIINDTLVTWTFPKAPCLFVHNNDIGLGIKFLQLFVVETLSKLKPGMATFEICDNISGGMDFMNLVKVNIADPTDIARGCCEVYHSDSQIKALYTTLTEEINSRKLSVIKECDNLDEYNKKMLDPAISGICKDYKFIILYNVSNELITSIEFKSLAQAGKRVGIYLLVMLSSDALFELGDASAAELIGSIDKIYFIREQGLEAKAKNYILEQITSDN